MTTEERLKMLPAPAPEPAPERPGAASAQDVVYRHLVLTALFAGKKPEEFTH